jgi:uncharacterized tellurite resistance protein B-like protein
MNGIINFGCDYLYLIRYLILKRDNSNVSDSVSDAAAKFFLISWGLSIDEIDAANKLFFEKHKKDEFDDFNNIVDRIISFISEDKSAKERLIIQLSAIAFMDYEIKDEEASYVRMFSELLDFRPSEFIRLTEIGSDTAIALNYFGDIYSKER